MQHQRAIESLLIKLLEAEQGPCLTIVSPFSILPNQEPDLKDKIRFNAAIQTASELVDSIPELEIRNEFKARLAEFSKDIGFPTGTRGKGLFLAPGIVKSIHFFHPVAEVIQLSSNFNVTALVEELSLAFEFSLLLFGYEKVAFFQGTGVSLKYSQTEFPTEDAVLKFLKNSGYRPIILAGHQSLVNRYFSLLTSQNLKVFKIIGEFDHLRENQLSEYLNGKLLNIQRAIRQEYILKSQEEMVGNCSNKREDKGLGRVTEKCYLLIEEGIPSQSPSFKLLLKKALKTGIRIILCPRGSLDEKSHFRLISK